MSQRLKIVFGYGLILLVWNMASFLILKNNLYDDYFGLGREHFKTLFIMIDIFVVMLMLIKAFRKLKYLSDVSPISRLIPVIILIITPFTPFLLKSETEIQGRSAATVLKIPLIIVLATVIGILYVYYRQLSKKNEEARNKAAELKANGIKTKGKIVDYYVENKLAYNNRYKVKHYYLIVEYFDSFNNRIARRTTDKVNFKSTDYINKEIDIFYNEKEIYADLHSIS